MSKRIHARVKVHGRVEYQHAGGKGDGILLDLSPQGCRIKGVSPGTCGTRLRLQLWLPDQSQPVQIELASVRWVKDDAFAVSFPEMPTAAQASLAQVVQLLHEAQQPEARVIQIPPSAFVGSEPGTERPSSTRRGFWEPMDDR